MTTRRSSMHALVLRSPHATPNSPSATRAGACRRRAILTAEDVKDLGGLPAVQSGVNPFTGRPMRSRHGVVRHVATPSHSCRGHDRSGRDAIEAIEVNWTPLPAVIGVAQAVKPGAPRSGRNIGNVLSMCDRDKKAPSCVRESPCGRRNIDRQSARRHQLHETRARSANTTPSGTSDADDRQPGSHRLRDILCQNVLKIRSKRCG